jgi:hypothetical protein
LQDYGINKKKAMEYERELAASYLLDHSKLTLASLADQVPLELQRLKYMQIVSGIPQEPPPTIDLKEAQEDGLSQQGQQD